MRLIGKRILKLTTIIMDTPHKAGYVGSYRMVKFCDHFSGFNRIIQERSKTDIIYSSNYQAVQYFFC
ncbi:hypothetical protein Lqui_1548 [Legionella quinlivanii]|uniref:Uncharacterized protein n=1 Tax=Legionella quinlivanii TaxID=45073 RepID=A0A0W0Y0J7_9GAMM|nr:hypothetical protein Lqui_1548 [Legionella quinlivanii]SEF46921.1 hypothetical protein SAMN02746093_00289 [Legionella quinlivanii DSM 21216]STY11821.1 Uncharacterised protein [Legionella quinlivanii]